ncbi:MAG: AGE family epimerase/isomerase [Candidatus Hydrogenedentes bacterium]|nr:AGE family epimerase/isomerase [Candidatus Hydrogenedentota bacterium]
MIFEDRAIQSIAHDLLAENLMPFWANHAWDHQYGGFLTRLDRQGRRLDDSEKILMMQVRMIASLSAAHRHGLTDRGYLDLASRGFDLVTRHMWDEANGGFHFSVTRDGAPKCTRKNTDFHAYAITGLTEFYLATRREDVLEWVNRVFDVVHSQATDRDLGYIEDFDDQNWPPLNADQMHLGDQAQIKTVDMHTNMMECLMYLAGATRDPKHLDALRRVTHLVRDRGIHPEHRCSITAFDYDWNPAGDARGVMTTSYGINVEMAWLLLAAADVLEESREDYRPAVLGLIDHALDFGFDCERGGLAAYGPMTGPVLDAVDLPGDRLLKPWWGQAELINALLDAHKWTGETKYDEALQKTFEWIWQYQIDHEFGDWYQDVYWDTGQPVTTDKGNEWKTSFHAGRALIRLAEAAL